MNSDLQSSLSNVSNFLSARDTLDRLSSVLSSGQSTTTPQEVRPPPPELKSTEEDGTCVEKKARRKKKWKKPKDKPSRPLSAYNLFFQSERSMMLGVDAPNKELESLKKRVHCRTHGKIGFAEMARAIGAKWKSLDPERRKQFEDKAQIEKKRYKTELASWKESHEASKDKDTEGLLAIATAALASEPMQRDPVHDRLNKNYSVGMDSGSGLSVNLEDLYRTRLSLIGRGNVDLTYMLALRHRQLELSRMESSLLYYPRAAESSANALLWHFQQGAAHTRLPSRSLKLYGDGHFPHLASSFATSNPSVTMQQMRSYLPCNPYRVNDVVER